MLARHRLLAALLLGAQAQALAANPGQADVCNELQVVDKERLAIYLLDAARVSRNPERWATLHREGFESLTPAVRILVDESFCDSPADAPPAAAGATPKCTATDAARLAEARHALRFLLANPDPAFSAVERTLDYAAYLTDARHSLRCVRTNQGEAIAAAPALPPVPFDVNTLPIRLRGLGEGIHFPRGDRWFAALERASLSFTDDDEANKETFKVTAVLGVALEFEERRGQIVPYFGVGLNTSRKDGQARESTLDIYRFGAAFAYRLMNESGSVSHWFVARPEYAANRGDDSETITGYLTYMPVGTLPLGNIPINRPVPILDNIVSIMPRADLRMNVGNFVRRGTRLPEDSRDFVRIGGSVGLSLISNLDWLPLELNLSETFLHALEGSPDTLSQFRSVLSVAFDKNKFFSLDLSYVRGRREDLAPREAIWSIGLGAKF